MPVGCLQMLAVPHKGCLLASAHRAAVACAQRAPAWQLTDFLSIVPIAEAFNWPRLCSEAEFPSLP